MEREHRIYKMSFASVYPMYVQKAERKARKKREVDEIILWLTGYSADGLKKQLASKVDFETFFAQAPKINPRVSLITGVVCGVRIEDIQEPLMKKIRYLDKLIDELAKGKSMDAILRVEGSTALAKPKAKPKAKAKAKKITTKGKRDGKDYG